MIVDVTLTRGKDATSGHLPNLEAHLEAVETLVRALRLHRNWYLDLANERDVGDARFVPPTELRQLRRRVRELDPPRLVTASFGGHDLSNAEIREAVENIGLDFLAPHRPRGPRSPGGTEEQTRRVIARMRDAGRVIPVHYQEPFRRGYTTWQPSAKDFLTDLRGALAGGAAGWCFHNGSQRGVPDEEPRRSFDLRTRRLWVQLDDEERQVITGAGKVVARGWTKSSDSATAAKPRK